MAIDISNARLRKIVTRKDPLVDSSEVTDHPSTVILIRRLATEVLDLRAEIAKRDRDVLVELGSRR
jgi:hypothetical protein